MITNIDYYKNNIKPLYYIIIKMNTEDINDKESINLCYESIKELFSLYKQNPYIKSRINYHITHLLPTTLYNEYKIKQQRNLRLDYLTNEQQQFIQFFLSEHKYYYLQNSSFFYFYDNITYSIVKEDIILHKLLTSISKDRKLMDWKYRTKINIIKQIKNRNLFNCIPETETIQNVLNLLYPLLFKDKKQVKYFLTIIGDNILKKNNDNIFLIKPKTNKLLSELNAITYIKTGLSNITHNFVTKFNQKYNYNNCRLIKINNNVQINNWKNILSTHGIDIICVAAHYSKRFESSENYIQNIINDENIYNYTLFLTNNNQEDIFNNFCNHSIQEYNNIDNQPKSNFSINWKNMHYIWKLYISKFSLPSTILLNTLKSLLKDKYQYDENIDTFYNITSPYLPCVSNFLLFWDKTIIVSNINNNNPLNDFEQEIEIDEICYLFKKWTQEYNFNTLSNGNIYENDVIKILKHFFSSIEIVENKYIIGVYSNMWNKNDDINNSLNQLKEFYFNKSNLNNNFEHIHFDDAYNFYYKYKNNNNFIISKRYFEKYLYLNLSQYIIHDNFIDFCWYSY